LSQTPKLDRLPVFVRPGAIIPRQPLVQSTSEKPRDPLQLDVYPGGDCRGELYLDDGVTLNGPNLHQSVTCTATPACVALSFGQREGTYRPWWRQIRVVVHGARPKQMMIPDQPRPATIQIQ
jgi:alpha-glucosidase